MSFSRFIARLIRGGPCGEDGAPPRRPSDDPAYAMAVTALGAKLARADGRVDAVEFQAFLEAFPPNPSAAKDVSRFFGLARETTRGFEAYASQLGRRYRCAPKLLEDVIHGLFYVAKSDGRISCDEMAFLEKVSGLFQLSPLTFRRLSAEHLGAPANDPYRLLEVAPDATDAEVRAAWRRALSEAHPDRAIGRGDSAELIETAQVRASALNAAFDEVMRERRTLDKAA